MAQQTEIAWTEQTWNPLRGCSKVSAGCEHCYAMHVAARFSGPGLAYHSLAKTEPVNWTGEIRLVEAKLYEPLRRKQPTLYFVNSMSDLFHEKVPDEWIDKIFAVMALCPRHTFQVLTKRAERMEKYFGHRGPAPAMTTIGASRRERVYTAAADFVDSDDKLAGMKATAEANHVYIDWLVNDQSPWPLPNVWLGVSVEDQAAAERRIQSLCFTPAPVRFLSCEPLLGPIDLRCWLNPPCEGFERDCEAGTCGHTPPSPIDWVIVGGESAQGNRVRWCNLDWIRSIVEQCRAAHVPVFVKQLGSCCYQSDPRGSGTHCLLPLQNRKGGDPAEWPADLQVRQFPACLEAVA